MVTVCGWVRASAEATWESELPASSTRSAIASSMDFSSLPNTCTKRVGAESFFSSSFIREREEWVSIDSLTTAILMNRGMSRGRAEYRSYVDIINLDEMGDKKEGI